MWNQMDFMVHTGNVKQAQTCLLYTFPSPRDRIRHLVCRLLLEKKIFLMIRRPPRSTPASSRRQRQMCIRDSPKCYEKEDGTLLIGLALTEDTDSLFPIVPEEQWAIEGKTISEWIITMVSLTNPQGGIIGQMEYHEAIKRLEPFILMKKDNWALIRAMTHEELDSLFGNLPRKLY